MIAFLGEEHGGAFLVQLGPEKSALLGQLPIGLVVVLVVQGQGLHQVSLYELCLRLYV